MQYRFLFLALAILFCSNGFAQDRSKFLTLELFGNGSYISVNYDARFSSKKNGLGYRVGIGSDMSNFRNPTLSIPVGVNYLVGNNKSFAEIGLVAIPDNYFSHYGSYFTFRTRANIGYRYVSKTGIMLNVLWTPLLTTNDEYERGRNDIGKWLWFGFGAGIRL